MAPLQKDRWPHPVPSRNGAHRLLASPCVGINPEDKCKLFWFPTTGSNLSSYRRVLPSVRANRKGYPRVVLLCLPLAQLQNNVSFPASPEDGVSETIAPPLGVQGSDNGRGPGPTARSTRKGIEAIIDEALDWERRSGATFEAEKTAVIHFTRKAYKADSEPFTIKGQAV